MTPRHTFAREAMTTMFNVTIAHPSATYAGQAATAAFAELELAETCLSRFIAHSDISRINGLGPGERAVVHPLTFECLQVGEAMRRASGGAFNMGYRTPHAELDLDAGTLSVGVRGGPVALDTGGIGKGLALDAMARVLADWDIASALLCASVSTVLALDPPTGEAGWPITFGPDTDKRSRALAHRAFSGSGTAVKGSHIVDPHTGVAVTRRFRAWSLAPTGAQADALSTAFMIMTPADIRALCQARPEFFGAWQDRPEGTMETSG